eukprot:3958438-Prymnesium_polylepis.2
MREQKLRQRQLMRKAAARMKEPKVDLAFGKWLTDWLAAQRSLAAQSLRKQASRRARRTRRTRHTHTVAP